MLLFYLSGIYCQRNDRCTMYWPELNNEYVLIAPECIASLIFIVSILWLIANNYSTKCYDSYSCMVRYTCSFANIVTIIGITMCNVLRISIGNCRNYRTILFDNIHSSLLERTVGIRCRMCPTKCEYHLCFFVGCCSVHLWHPIDRGLCTKIAKIRRYASSIW